MTKGLIATVDLVDADLARFNWSAHETEGGWYAARRTKGKRVYLHRVVAERAGLDIDGKEVDHRNTDRLDCTRKNLRPATHGQNSKNLKRSANNRSGIKGVSWHSGARKWAASIKSDGSDHYLGLFVSKKDAAEAYARASERLHGAFGRIA